MTGARTPRVGIISPHRVEAGIEEVRGLMQTKGKLWIDKAACQQGIDALENYHKDYRDKLETFSDKPCHDWASHGADAFRYLAIAYRYHIRQAGEMVGRHTLEAPAGDGASAWPATNPIEYTESDVW